MINKEFLLRIGFTCLILSCFSACEKAVWVDLQPDLVISNYAIEDSLYSGVKVVFLECEVQNIGTKVAQESYLGVKVRVKNLSSGDEIVAVDSLHKINKLDPGEKQVSNIFVITINRPGEYLFSSSACVDSTDLVPEINELNNNIH